MKVILTGATGFLGHEVLKQLLTDHKIKEAVVLSRKSTDTKHPKLREIITNDFLDYSNIRQAITADACIWCLGVSQLQVTKEEYIKITFDYAIQAAKAMLAQNPNIRFCFVSGASADQEEKGISLQGKIKGRTEKYLAQLSPNVFLFRPAFIKPATRKVKRPPAQTIAWYITSLLDLFSDKFSIRVATLAKSLINVAKNGSDLHLLNNIAIRQSIKF